MMGLFADLNHAWIAIDNSLYLWDYTHPDPDLIGFEEQQQQIKAVRLVTPRVGVFVSTITQMLAVATSSEIILVGLASQDAPGGGKAISLFLTRLSLSIKGMTVNLIEGSAASGRIFFRRVRAMMYMSSLISQKRNGSRIVALRSTILAKASQRSIQGQYSASGKKRNMNISLVWLWMIRGVCYIPFRRDRQ